MFAEQKILSARIKLYNNKVIKIIKKCFQDEQDFFFVIIISTKIIKIIADNKNVCR